MIARVSLRPATLPLKTYRYQMLQASFKTGVPPISSYSNQGLYEKQQTYAKETGTFLQTLMEKSNGLFESANSLSSLPSGKALPLEDASNEPITLDQSPENPSVRAATEPYRYTKQVADVLERYNQLVQFVRPRRQSESSALLIKRDVAAIGIQPSENGLVTIDEQTFNEAIAYNPDTVDQLVKPLLKNLRDNAHELRRNSTSFLRLKTNNPYEKYTLPQLFLNQAAATGLFYNQQF